MVENIEYLCAKLDVEALRDASDVIVFEDGKIKLAKAGAVQNVAAGVSPKIEAPQVPRG